MLKMLITSKLDGLAVITSFCSVNTRTEPVATNTE
jgi:hypothetical protein